MHHGRQQLHIFSPSHPSNTAFYLTADLLCGIFKIDAIRCCTNGKQTSSERVMFAGQCLFLYLSLTTDFHFFSTIFSLSVFIWRIPKLFQLKMLYWYSLKVPVVL